MPPCAPTSTCSTRRSSARPIRCSCRPSTSSPPPPGDLMDNSLTITELSAAIHAGEVTSVDVVSELLERADRLDPLLGTYIVRFDEGALAAAAVLDAEL